MVDRAYKAALPSLRHNLEKMREDFSKIDSKTNWVQLRIEPLLKHIDSLEGILRSRRFSGEFSRLRRGVVMFHADLVYLRTNVQALAKILQAEKDRIARSKK
jgi:hypothetical protein